MPVDGPVCFLDGEYVPVDTAVISIDDRGFLFADACYEVTAVFGGRCIALDRHLARLQRGLDELRIPFEADSLAPVHAELIECNGLADAERASVYVQVTRGVATRTHGFPDRTTPTVLARAQRIAGPSAATIERGSSAITRSDERWGRVDLKTTGLLANVLAQQAALDQGVDDVILHRNGTVTEGAHTNVMGIIDGVVVTAPTDRRILAGVTRGIVLELAADAGVPVEEREWTLGELRAADEVVMTSTTAGVRPIVTVDGHPVGDGDRGPVTVHLQELYAAFVAAQ